MCRSSSTWLTVTGSKAWQKERSLCSGLQLAGKTQETPNPRARGMPPASPVYGAHAHVTTRSMRCTHRQYLHAQVHGTQERPHTQHKHRTRWSRSTRTTTPGGNPQRRARQQQQQTETGDSARPTPMTSAAPGAGNTHQAHPPQAPPTLYAARTRNQRPSGAQANTPALPTQPGPKVRRRQGWKRHEDNWNRNQTKPHHNVPTTAPVPQTKPQATRHASVPPAWSSRSIAKTRTTAACCGATPTTSSAPAMEAEGGHKTHRPEALHTRCTNGKRPDTPTQRFKGTPTLPRDGWHNGAPRAKRNPRTEGTATAGPRTGPHPVRTHWLQRPNLEPNHKHHTVSAYPEQRPHGVQRPRHGPLPHTSTRGAAPRRLRQHC